jgi:hypothetical protein
VKGNTKCPEALLQYFNSEVSKVTQLHFFEKAPQNKFAVSYALKSTTETHHIILVYSMVNLEVHRYLYSDSEISSLCTLDEGILIAGTREGSVLAYDLKNFNEA